MNIVAILSALYCSILPLQIGQITFDIRNKEPDLIQVLRDAGVTDPENIADYTHLFPRNTFSSAIVRGDTEITIEAADGRSYTISNIRLTLSHGNIVVRAVVEGWDVEGVFSWYSDNQVKLEYQFQVPLDIYESPPVRVIFGINRAYNWLPTLSGDQAARMPSLIGSMQLATACKCIGKGSGDGGCTQRDCDHANGCGGVKECLHTEVGGSTNFLGSAIFPVLLFSFVLIMNKKRAPDHAS